ncbi:MAG: ketoacyl-ACP synthase III [Alphaproteobacteria bacterium]|nr:ketoacyl-ACP synthase III [Alphaproteobacteria bacterium]
MSIIRSIIRSTGGYLPENILTNAALAEMVDTSDEWIMQRSGIKERCIAADDETTGDMAVAAGRMAMERGCVEAQDIDGVIIATTTPDKTFPSVAVKVQDELGLPVGLAFDVQAVCAGFLYALSVADSFIQTGKARRILVVGAEKMSSILDWEDRSTCVLFGDGAGAVILERGEGDGGISDRGVLSTYLYANGGQADLLYTDGGTSTSGDSGHIKMQGREVFKYAVQYMSDVVMEALDANNLVSSDIDWLVPHQANSRIIEATAKKLKLPMEQVIMTVERHGNTSAASIPLALHEAVFDGRIKQNDLLLLEGMGGGLTWGAALIRF